MTKPLSPAAQAVSRDAQSVLDAVCSNTEPDCDTQHLIAAALRAAADQVVPEEPPHPLANSAEARKFGTPEEWMYEGIERDARQETRRRLLAIADELEAP